MNLIKAIKNWFVERRRLAAFKAVHARNFHARCDEIIAPLKDSKAGRIIDAVCGATDDFNEYKRRMIEMDKRPHGEFAYTLLERHVTVQLRVAKGEIDYTSPTATASQLRDEDFPK